jgi:hypothetical protein
MNAQHSTKARAFALLSCAAMTASSSFASPFGLISGSGQMVDVSSKVFNGYVRERLPDGIGAAARGGDAGGAQGTAPSTL